MFTYKIRTSSHTTGKRGGRGGGCSWPGVGTLGCLQTRAQLAALPTSCPHQGLPPLSFPKTRAFPEAVLESRFPHSSVNWCLVILARMKKEGACQYCFTAKLSLTRCMSYPAEPDTAKNCHNLRKSNHTVNTHLHIKQGSNCKPHHRCSPGSSLRPCNPWGICSPMVPSARSSSLPMMLSNSTVEGKRMWLKAHVTIAFCQRWALKGYQYGDEAAWTIGMYEMSTLREMSGRRCLVCFMSFSWYICTLVTHLQDEPASQSHGNTFHCTVC